MVPVLGSNRKISLGISRLHLIQRGEKLRLRNGNQSRPKLRDRAEIRLHRES